jgi:hypothetical protein
LTYHRESNNEGEARNNNHATMSDLSVEKTGQ